MQAQEERRKTEEDLKRFGAAEAVDAHGMPIPMRQAAVELIDSRDYEKYAKRAGVTAVVARGWAEDPLFIAAIGWLVKGATLCLYVMEKLFGA